MTNTLADLIIKNEGLIYSIINKYSNYYDIQDLYQVGVIGYIKAYKNYNNSHNVKFTSYAYKYILGEVIKYINNNRNFKANKATLYGYKKIMEGYNILTQRLMKEPSTFELSLFLEIDEKIIIDVLTSTSKIESLDKIVKEDSKNLYLIDIIPDNKNDLNIDQIILKEELNKLTNNEKKIIQKRYYEDKTQQETAMILGINQVQVSRHEKKILQKLKTKIGSD